MTPNLGVLFLFMWNVCTNNYDVLQESFTPPTLSFSLSLLVHFFFPLPLVVADISVKLFVPSSLVLIPLLIL